MARLAIAGFMSAGAFEVHAVEPAAPQADAEFLEYIGSWEGDDADWQVLAADLATVPGPAQAQPVARVSERTTKAPVAAAPTGADPATQEHRQ